MGDTFDCLTGELINKKKDTSSLTADTLQDDPLYLDEEDKLKIEKNYVMPVALQTSIPCGY